MIYFRPITSTAIEYYRRRDIYDIPGEFDINEVIIGYNAYENGLLAGVIMLIDRGDTWTLDGYNEIGGIGFIKATKKILNDYELMDTKKPLYIIRDMKRPDLRAIYERFGFDYTGQVSIWHTFKYRGKNETEKA